MFVTATYDREHKTVYYKDEEGSITLYIGGSFAWRFNNPGNIVASNKYWEGAIGKGQRISSSPAEFVIFSDIKMGEQAKRVLIKRTYHNYSVQDMMHRYAPPSENKTEKYIDFICTHANVSRYAVIGQLNDEQFQNVADAISKYEGDKPGRLYSPV